MTDKQQAPKQKPPRWRSILAGIAIVLAVMTFGAGYAGSFLLRQAEEPPPVEGRPYMLESYVIRGKDVFRRLDIEALQEGDRLFIHLVSGIHGTIYTTWLDAQGKPTKSFPEMVLKHMKIRPKLGNQFYRELRVQDEGIPDFLMIICQGQDVLSPYRLEKAMAGEGDCVRESLSTQAL